MSHIFDALTLYCIRCGMSLRDASRKHVLFCRATPNVVAISHRVRGKRLKRLQRLDRLGAK